MRDGGHSEGDRRDHVDHDDFLNFGGKTFFHPGQRNEGKHARQPEDEGGRPQGGQKTGRDDEAADQSEKDGTVTHQQDNVRILERHAVERPQPLRPEDAKDRQKIHQSDENEDGGDGAADQLLIHEISPDGESRILHWPKSKSGEGSPQ